MSKDHEEGNREQMSQWNKGYQTLYFLRSLGNAKVLFCISLDSLENKNYRLYV
jgi:hypothetical protein